MEFPYQEGVWSGPLIVLIDRDSASASSRFAALIQDNHAGIVMGEPATGGGGRTDGGTPTTLRNSKAKMLVPDIAMFRLDGSNLARGIQPDVLVGFEPAAGTRLRVARLLEKLPEALLRVRAK
jgi:C-terminal processing protease CtpA/Prc